MHKVYVQTVTLTFDLVTWFLFPTHPLVMLIICAKLFLNLTMHDKVMGLTRTGFAEVYAQSLSADCNLDLATWFLCATYHLVMIICAKLLYYAIMYSYVMARTLFWYTQTHTYGQARLLRNKMHHRGFAEIHTTSNCR